MKVMAALGVAHDLCTKEQAHQQDSHGGEGGALDSGPAAAAGGARCRVDEDRLTR